MNPRTRVLFGPVVLAVLSRLVPHPPNFTPIGALALFGAAHFRSGNYYRSRFAEIHKIFH